MRRQDATYISRIRKTDGGAWLSLCASRTICARTALNAVQIAECLINRKLLKSAAEQKQDWRGGMNFSLKPVFIGWITCSCNCRCNCF